MEIGLKRLGALAGALGLLLCLGTSAVFAADAYDLLASGTRALNEGNQELALEYFAEVEQPAAGEDSLPFVRARIQSAKIYFSREDYRQVEKLCREVLILFPDNLEAANLLGRAEAALTPTWLKLLQDVRRYFPSLLKASVMTLLLVLITMIVSPLCGLFVALGRISRFGPLRGLTWFYIWIFRGTPLLLQLFFIYYGLPQLGLTLKPFTAAILGLGLNYSAYLAEIIRGAIQSIDAGQMEAAKSIGMTYWQAMRRIIIPQTYKRLMPPVGNEFIALIKDTALVSTIAMVELMRTADQIFNATFNIFILVQAAIIYLLMTSFFTYLFSRLEERLGVYENR